MPLTWLFSKPAGVFSGNVGPPELRELDRIKGLTAAGPGEVRS